MLFLGLGTGLGSAMVVDGIVVPLELGHLPYRKRTYEDYVGTRGLERMGHKKWQRRVNEVVELLVSGLLPDYVVLGGGNVKELEALPPGCRPGRNTNAFAGGFRLWGASDGRPEAEPSTEPISTSATAGNDRVLATAPSSAAPTDKESP
jgi:polyphosphate glucokinase